MPAYLTLLRHAKSDWGDASLDDRDRPLNARGQSDADAVATALRSIEPGVPPVDRVLCSGALRTRQTLNALIDGGAIDPAAATLVDALYLASPATLMAHIEGNPPASHLLVLAHNPGIETLASELAVLAGDAVGRIVMKTASLCRFERSTDEPSAWRFVEQLTPRG